MHSRLQGGVKEMGTSGKGEARKSAGALETRRYFGRLDEIIKSDGQVRGVQKARVEKAGAWYAKRGGSGGVAGKRGGGSWRENQTEAGAVGWVCLLRREKMGMDGGRVWPDQIVLSIGWVALGGFSRGEGLAPNAGG